MRGVVAIAVLLTSMEAWAASPGSTTQGKGTHLGTPKEIVSGRFEVYDEVVRDKTTGLIWVRSPGPAQREWDDAVEWCNKLSLGKLTRRWRLPAQGISPP